MISRFLLLIAVAAVAVPLAAASAAPLPQRPAAVLGAEYIRTTQQADGGFGGFGPGQTMDAIYAIRAAGLDPNEFVTGGNSPSDFLLSVAAEATDAGSAAKAALAARALGMDPRDVGGVDLVEVAASAYNVETGGYAEDAFTHSLVVVGLTRLGVPAPTGAIQFLREAQIDDGGWGFGGASDPDTTGIVLQALAGAGAPVSDATVAAGLKYLRTAQGNDGGWGFDPNESNAASTAFVVQALNALGEDPGGWDKNGVDPVDYLLSLQRPDGSFPGFDPAYATMQVVPALAGRSFGSAVDTPIPPAPPRQVAPGPPATGTGLAPNAGVNLLPMAAILLAITATGVARRHEDPPAV